MRVESLNVSDILSVLADNSSVLDMRVGNLLDMWVRLVELVLHSEQS